MATSTIPAKVTDLIDTITITAQSGITNNLFGRKVGKMASINGFISASSAFGSGQHVLTVAEGQRPVSTIRIPIGLSDQAYNPPKSMGYLSLGSDGKVYITAPSGNGYNVAYFSFSYVIQA